MSYRAFFLGSALLAIVAAHVQADDPFLITAQTTTGSQSLTTSGSSLPNLLTSLIKDQNQFGKFANADSTYAIRYGGVGNAILIDKNAANTSATVTLPGIHFAKTFTAANAGDLETQIKDFARKNGATIYGDFIRSINETSEIGVADGNPLAATAIFADTSYTQFGLQPTPFPANGGACPSPLDVVATPNIRLELNGGYAHTDTSSAYFAGGDFSFGFKFGDRVGLVFTTPFNFRDVDGAEVYNVAEEVSLPILILAPTGGSSLEWMLTPTFTAGGAGSVDLASGGVFLGGGITSSFSVQLGGVIFTLADQYDYFHGFPITIGEYKFETNLDQEVLKNGVKATKYFGDILFIDAGITYTDFLQKAAVRDYWSPTAGLGFRLSSNAGIRVGYTGDFGHDFVVHGGDVELYLNF